MVLEAIGGGPGIRKSFFPLILYRFLIMNRRIAPQHLLLNDDLNYAKQ